MSNRCKAELLRWLFSLEFSERVLPNPQRPEMHLKDARRAWPKALKAAGTIRILLGEVHSDPPTLPRRSISALISAPIRHASPVT